ncbi:MAG: acyltransferase domain-containing protein, partial [Bradymonadaceae bacterium]
VGDEREELVEQLEAAGDEVAESGHGRSPIDAQTTAFVFSGQGGQWPGMGEVLENDPAAARAIERCEAAIREIAGWSVRESFRGPASWTDDVARIQPLLFVVQVALAEMWRERGVEPEVTVGHSLGEVAAAHVAGHLTLEDAVRVICTRSDLLRRIAGEGAMAVVGLGPEEASEEI